MPHIDYSGFKSLFDVQQNATLLISESNEIILANPIAHSLLGYNNHELHGLPIGLIIPKLDIEQLGHQSTHDCAHETHPISINNNLTALTKDGAELNVTVNLAPLAPPKTPAVMTIVHDRHRYDAAPLSESEERLKLAKRAAGLGLYDRDLTNDVLYWDDHSRELLGFSANEEITYEKFEACVHPEDREMRRMVLTQALDAEDNGQYQTEFRIIRKNDGAERWITSAGQINYESGRPTRLLGLMRDVTELKAMEHQSNLRRNQIEDLLKQQIAVHTATAIAHEINQPLTAISAYSEVALHSLKNNNINSESLNRALEGCVREAQRAGDTLHELMNYLNQRELVIEPTDINQLIKSSIEIAKKDSHNDFNSSLHLEKKLPPVACCPLQVQKVILNLIHNAIDAVQESGITRTNLNIKAQKNKQGNMVLITVQDNGPGFAKEISERVFQPFFTTKRNGIGMGLAISRSLIEANGGTLWHEPNSQTGAIINFTLPFAI